MSPHHHPQEAPPQPSPDSGKAASRKTIEEDDDDVGYDSDSSFDNYYLFCNQEREFMDLISPSLHSACEVGRLSWHNPLPIINILKTIITTKEKWKNLPSHEKYLNDMINFMHKTGLQNIAITRPSSSRSFSNKLLPDNIPADAEPILIIRRWLNMSDILDDPQRLLMPCKQVETHSFLTEEEAAEMERGVQIPIRVMDSGGRVYSSYLRKTGSGHKTYCYEIRKPWNDIKMANGFSEGMDIKVSAFRQAENNEVVIAIERFEG